MRKSIMSTLLAASLMLVQLAACSSQNSATKQETAKGEQAQTTLAEAQEATQNKDKKAEAKGKLTLAGSTSMEKLCEAMSESYMADNPNLQVTVEYTGSGAGLESLAKGSVQIGNASRALKDAEKKNGLVENIVAIDGIAVIANKANTVQNLSKADLLKIYTGEITNWKDLGGLDEAIVVIGREAGSGTRDAFEELVKVKDKCKYAQELDSTGAVLAKVKATEGGIGYVSLDVVNEQVKSLQIDGVDATEEQILAGKYQLQRPFVMATKSEISKQDANVQSWFSYIKSEKGKEIIKKVGLIVKD